MPCHNVNYCSSHSINGDIAIQWEWSKFDPSQNPNPLTDYDKTLTIDYVYTRRTRNPKFLPIGRNRRVVRGAGRES